MKKIISITFFILLSFITSPKLLTAQINIQTLWQQGTEKYNNYRIPSVITTQQGTLLAFCEGREAGDTGDIDLLMKRSEDNGKTWSSEQIIWDDGTNTK